MSRTKASFLATIVMAGITAGAQQPGPRWSTSELASHVGQRGTVCGTVLTLVCASPISPMFLTFETSGDDTVNISVPQQFRPRLEPHRRLIGREVCASGAITRKPPPPGGSQPTGYDILVSAPDGVQVTAGGAGSSPADGVYDNCDADVKPPNLVRQVRAQYTNEAMRAKIEGKVFLEGTVAADGGVAAVRIVRSLDSKLGLDREAVKAFSNFRFAPATRDGQPVPFVVQVEIAFTLR